MKDNKLICEAINNMIQDLNLGNDTNYISDGSHTYGELYHHRAVLFASLVSIVTKARLLTSYGKNDKPEHIYCWKSKLHDDGTMFDGYFIVGIKTLEGMATYHYDMKYWDMFDCQEIERAPEFDGHTPDMAIERIGKMFLRDNYIPYEEDDDEDEEEESIHLVSEVSYDSESEELVIGVDKEEKPMIVPIDEPVDSLIKEEKQEEYIDIYIALIGEETFSDYVYPYSSDGKTGNYIVCFTDLDLCIECAKIGEDKPHTVYSSIILKSRLLDPDIVATGVDIIPKDKVLVDFAEDIKWVEKFVGYIRVFVAESDGVVTPIKWAKTHENCYVEFDVFTNLLSCINNTKYNILHDRIADVHHTFIIYYADVKNLDNVKKINGSNITVDIEGLTWKVLDSSYSNFIRFYEEGSSLNITWKYDGGEYTT